MIALKRNIFTFSLALSLLFCLFSCAGVQAKPENPIIKYNVTPKANITNFQYYLDEKSKMAKKPCLTFKMTIKSLSDEPSRFSVKITLPKEGKSVGGLIPRKGVKDKVTKKRGPAVLKYGEEKSVSYPMFHYEIPKNIEVDITVMK